MSNEHKDDIDRLVVSVRGVLKKAVESVAEKSQTLRTPRLVQTVERTGANSLSGFQESRIEIDDSIFQSIDREVMARLEEDLLPTVMAVPVLRLRFLSDARGKELAEPINPTWLRNTLTAPLVQRYLELLPLQLEWNEEVFGSLIREFTKFMESSTITLINKSSLKNFNTNTDVLEIEPGLRIERVSWEESKKLYEESHQYGMGNDAFAYAQIEFAIVNEIPVLPIPGMFHTNSDSHELFDRLLTALRLVNPGIAHRELSWSSYREPKFILGGSSRSLPYRLSFSTGPLMELDVAGASAEIKTLMDSITASNDSSLHIALRRFEFAYSRPQLEDQLVDIWIAL
jgi:hypothetical protein